MTTIDPNKHIQRQRTKDEIRQALSDMCHRKPTMHVPPQVEDTDVILYDAFKELLDLREQVQQSPMLTLQVEDHFSKEERSTFNSLKEQAL
jgi:hypothetical protein